MTDSKKLTFFEKLAEYMKLAPEKEVFDTLNNAIDTELQTLGKSKEKEIVAKIQFFVEKEYSLTKGSLSYCFSQKERHLTEPKKLWVLVVCALITDTKMVIKYIGNGLTRGHIYRYQDEFLDMSDKLKHQRIFKEKFNKIIKSYGEAKQLL